MSKPTYDDLLAAGVISEKTASRVKRAQSSKFFSLYWELRILLYTGVMMLTTGMGILIYKNIDSIGHQVILCAIAAVSAGSFMWCNKHRVPFSYNKVETDDSFSDYILLLGTLSFLSFLGYLQFQYKIFGMHYGLATFIPMLVLFFIAYSFDHLGILTIAIANLGIWMGVSVTPKHLLASNTFDNQTAIYTYLALGFLLLGFAYITERYQIKKHFFFSYHHYGVHLSYISLLSGYFFYDYGVSLFWLAAFGLAAAYIYNQAVAAKSFYFVVVTIVYTYVAISACVVRSFIFIENEVVIFLGLMYFILSGIWFVNVLISSHRKLKEYDRL